LLFLSRCCCCCCYWAKEEKLWGRQTELTEARNLAGKILSHARCKKKSKLREYFFNISSAILNFYFSDDSVTPLEQLLLDVD
jgi:hypothetical protein